MTALVSPVSRRNRLDPVLARGRVVLPISNGTVRWFHEAAEGEAMNPVAPHQPTTTRK